MSTTLSTADQLHQKIHELALQLEADTPAIATALLKIHSDIGKAPELLHLLTEDEIGTIAAGLQLQSKIQILAPAAKKPSKKTLEKNLGELDI